MKFIKSLICNYLCINNLHKVSKIGVNVFKKEQFYNALERALHNYLKSKLHIETSEFNKEKINELLTKRSVGAASLGGFVSVLTACEIARYTPLSSVDMQNDYEKATHAINMLDKQLK